MRKIIAAEFMSLDGVFEAPDTWHSQFVDGEVGQAMMAQMAGWDSLLLGRRTYEGFAEAWPSRSSADFGPIADFMNNSPKYVVSTTLKSADWNNTTLIGSHPRRAIEELKRTDGRDIAVLGSSTLLQFLLAEGAGRSGAGRPGSDPGWQWQAPVQRWQRVPPLEVGAFPAV